MGHAQIADETQGAAIAVDVIVAAVAGPAVRMANAQAQLEGFGRLEQRIDQVPWSRP